MSGEDHFSALKPPQCKQRCANLTHWTRERYGCVDDNDDDDDIASVPQQYGVYSETPDLVPLVGTIHETSRICYLLGCNAWGQTVLSYVSSLVPALLGRQPWTTEQRDAMELFTIRRFTHLQQSH